uniref:Cytochrome c oxidase subunit 2 n=1 Tax=Quadrula quadrula TaxID=52372 RepID=D2DVZ2_QUAQU|nr:cytochrome c oxidase subunit II [Quadrula quadrula]
MSLWGQFGLQEGTSILMVEVHGLYDYAMFILVLIFSFVGYVMLKMLVSKMSTRVCLENQWLEVVWTIAPFGLLLALGLPSIKLLYLMDEVNLPEASVKAVGHQWYWSYEYSDSLGSQYSYDSYMISDSLIDGGYYRLLEVDNRCIVPSLLQMRGLVTSDDVIHSWAIPSSSVKVDGVPGRINQVGLCFIYSGVFYGQCSELCGVNHSYMPVCVEAVSTKVFLNWIFENHGKDVNNSGVVDSANGFSLRGFLMGVFKKIVKVLKMLGSLYVMWFYYVIYYGLYVPAKFAVFGGCDLIQWTLKSCLAIAEWMWWFLFSPVDASIFAFGYFVGKVSSGLWFVVSSPVTAVIWLAKGVWKGVCAIVWFPLTAFEAWFDSMSSFTDNDTKNLVVWHIYRNTKEFVWALMERYKD